jgi:hypothetical protein
MIGNGSNGELPGLTWPFTDLLELERAVAIALLQSDYGEVVVSGRRVVLRRPGQDPGAGHSSIVGATPGGPERRLGPKPAR